MIKLNVNQTKFSLCSGDLLAGWLVDWCSIAGYTNVRTYCPTRLLDSIIDFQVDRGNTGSGIAIIYIAPPPSIGFRLVFFWLVAMILVKAQLLVDV